MDSFILETFVILQMFNEFCKNNNSTILEGEREFEREILKMRKGISFLNEKKFLEHIIVVLKMHCSN